MGHSAEMASKVIESLISTGSLQDRVIDAYVSAFVPLQSSLRLHVFDETFWARVDALNSRLDARPYAPWCGDRFESTVRTMPEFELESCADEMAHIALGVIELLGEPILAPS